MLILERKLPISVAITLSQIPCIMWIKGMDFHSCMGCIRVSQKLWDWNPLWLSLSERINRITESIVKDYEMRK